jgi:hypothetical protein
MFVAFEEQKFYGYWSEKCLPVDAENGTDTNTLTHFPIRFDDLISATLAAPIASSLALNANLVHLL